VPTTEDGNTRSSSSPVEGDTARVDNGGWRRGSVGAVGGVGNGTESGTRLCMVIALRILRFPTFFFRILGGLQIRPVENQLKLVV
jgi:hypothetical protein